MGLIIPVSSVRARPAPRPPQGWFPAKALFDAAPDRPRRTQASRNRTCPSRRAQARSNRRRIGTHRPGGGVADEPPSPRTRRCTPVCRVERCGRRRSLNCTRRRSNVAAPCRYAGRAQDGSAGYLIWVATLAVYLAIPAWALVVLLGFVGVVGIFESSRPVPAATTPEQ